MLTEADAVETVFDADGLVDVEATLKRLMALTRRRNPFSLLIPGLKKGMRTMLQMHREQQIAERGETPGPAQ